MSNSWNIKPSKWQNIINIYYETNWSILLMFLVQIISAATFYI